MPQVTFHPKEGTEYNRDWPIKVIGDGIELQLDDVIGKQGQFAQYRDQFWEYYEFFGPSYGPWTVEIRED